VVETRHAMQFDGPRAVGQLAFVADRLQFEPPVRAGQPVGLDRVRRGRGAFDKEPVGAVSNDRGPFGDRGTDPAHVVPVMMHRDDEPDRFPGDQLLRLRNDGQGPRLAVRRVHEDDVILHLDGEAVMGTTRQPEHAVGQLLRREAPIPALRRRSPG
jgi:hypothetical protein